MDHWTPSDLNISRLYRTLLSLLLLILMMLGMLPQSLAEQPAEELPEQETMAAWTLLRDRVDYMHIKDALSTGDVVPPGLGEGRVQEIAKAYMLQGGTRFTIEPHLFDFGTFKALETSEQTSILGEKYHFHDSDEAFDEAVRRFRALIA